MDIEKLRCVASLARLGNITRAAEENHITQPSMTARINAVEKELGLTLFVRTNKGVSPTPAGLVFAEAAGEILRSYHSAVLRAREAGIMAQHILTIGFNNANFGAVLYNMAQIFRARMPGLKLQFCKSSISDLNRCLQDGRADVIISNHFEMRLKANFRFIPILRTTPCVYVPKGHSLAGKPSVSLGDLAGERLLCACSNEDPSEMSAAAKALYEAGIPFTKESLVYNEESIFSMVEAGIGLYPAALWYRHSCPKGVACVPMELKVEDMIIVLAWQRADLDAYVNAIAELIRQEFKVLEAD